MENFVRMLISELLELPLFIRVLLICRSLNSRLNQHFQSEKGPWVLWKMK
jgi:hypothetical protein